MYLTEIRNYIKKTGGDFVNVTLYLENKSKNVTDNKMILECFNDAQVLLIFKKLKIEEQNEIVQNINTAATENIKTDKIVKFIAKLEQMKQKF